MAKTAKLPPTVRELLAETLRTQGFEGLYNPTGPCGCTLDDLAPCEVCNFDECVGGHAGSDPRAIAQHEEDGLFVLMYPGRRNG